MHIVAAGVMVPEAVEASRALATAGICASVFAVTSPTYCTGAFALLCRSIRITRPSTYWITFGQSGSRGDLYHYHGVDTAAIAHAAHTLLARGPALG